jgi:hypothetical protein
MVEDIKTLAALTLIYIIFKNVEYFKKLLSRCFAVKENRSFFGNILKYLVILTRAF